KVIIIYSVCYHGSATETQAKQPNGAIMNVYATPWSMKLSVDTNYTVQYLAHVNEVTTNPHRVKAERLKTDHGC
ncbi:hypothetical protein ACLBO7_30470, partial [Klebsiella pneumoniae]